MSTSDTPWGLTPDVSAVDAVSGRRRAENGERVGDLEAGAREAVDGGRAAARPAGRARLAGRLQQAAPEQHALEVRGRYIVAERGAVEAPQLRDRERPPVRARSRCWCRRASPAGAPGPRGRSRHGRTPSRAGRPRGASSCPRHARVDVGGDEPEVGRRHEPLVGVPARFAPRLELLECASSRTSTLAARCRRIELFQRLPGRRATRPEATRSRGTAPSPVSRGAPAARPRGPGARPRAPHGPGATLW